MIVSPFEALLILFCKAVNVPSSSPAAIRSLFDDSIKVSFAFEIDITSATSSIAEVAVSLRSLATTLEMLRNRIMSSLLRVLRSLPLPCREDSTLL